MRPLCYLLYLIAGNNRVNHFLRLAVVKPLAAEHSSAVVNRPFNLLVDFLCMVRNDKDRSALIAEI